MLKVIQGGLCSPTLPYVTEDESRIPGRDDLLREAKRRIRATGYETWRNRENLTGIPVPRDISFLAMQISYAAEAIGRLAHIPADFRSDIYWPA